nr:RsmB/NOP family class I SAM-dependent RNA methyltransferase [Sulfitobacter aestuariivivens]
MSQGRAAEQALTRWARNSRFAGSKDRAAVRDHVFDVLRCRRTAAHFGQGQDGRALMIGLLHQQGADLSALFDGAGHAPPPLSDKERAFPGPPADLSTALNLPDWLVPLFEASLGADTTATAQALQTRAPVHLRVNVARTTVLQAAEKLALEGVDTERNSLSPTALTVTQGARRIKQTSVFKEGLVELQDGASQAVVDAIPAGRKVLDYCAGGGGKALALAAQTSRRVYAHDADPNRMTDLPERANRAGTSIAILNHDQVLKTAPYDVILCDAPCSGSGAWRRAPGGKWLLTPDRLTALTQIQDDILDATAPLLSSGGTLVYATCSVLASENEDRVAAFLDRHAGWASPFQRRFGVTSQGDGFFTAHLTRE